MNTKRYGLTIIVTLITLISITLAGCQPSTPTAQPTVAEEPPPAPTAEPAEVEGEPASAPEAEPTEEVELRPLRVAIVIHGLTNDGSFSQSSYLGALEAGELPNVEVAVTENVDVPDAPGVLREYALAGYDVLWAQSGAISSAALKVAPEFPDKSFVLLGDETTQRDPNVYVLANTGEPAYFLAGALAGLMTKSNIVAYQNAEAFPVYEAAAQNFEAGAKYVNPEVEVLVSWTGDFNDPTKGKQSAEGLIEQGVDVIHTGLNVGQFGTIQAAQQADHVVWLIGNHVDSKKILGIDLFLTSVAIDYETTIPLVISAIQRGETSDWVFENIKGGLEQGTIDLTPTYGAVPEDVLARVDEIRQGLISGEIDYITIQEVIQQGE